MPKRKSTPALGLASKAIDPTLDALFASSSGPVKAPLKTRYPAAQELSVPDTKDKEVGDQEVDDEVLSEASQELDYGDEDEPTSDGSRNDAQGERATSADNAISADETSETEKPRRERKRKRKEDNEDLEANYLAELTKHDVTEPAEKRLKAEQGDVDGDQDVPVHESLGQDSGAPDLEKAGRTVFLGNVSAEAITSKKAKKMLITHLSSVLDQNDTAAPQRLESIRFRSVAFSTGSMPKRAAYITKSVMSATTQSANAYAVFSSPAAARKVAAELNGSEVLGRHIRVDSVAHPSVMAHRRCVFVGNLGFVDDETVLKTDSTGKTGKVENVRVVRDPKTRVGKGFAYVQFYDGNDVESALLLDGKKFPPMLPRPLRVTRAKDPRKTASAQERIKAKAIASSEAERRTKYEHKSTAEEQAAAGRAGKLLGRAGAAKHRIRAPGGVNKSPEQIVFEGRRASAKDGRPKDLKLGKKSSGKSGRPKNRGARRAAGWKKSA
ncbi:RNA recognition motif domain-containing protein [Hirsutella rhossiliensis]|uniref:Nucleolar protein 12 n=1 Tax=Hirsutella rhossiliensis TaxID=111463 RepID=A0A9P8MZU2_9HYPO|nr:RNA recognition motif domain-containing protein [Hirsutella rhossiliensis]KAH0963344.1 RNA recognition motif domain-containing protein [Hirsutella rhossiliensis]